MSFTAAGLNFVVHFRRRWEPRAWTLRGDGILDFQMNVTVLLAQAERQRVVEGHRTDETRNLVKAVLAASLDFKEQVDLRGRVDLPFHGKFPVS